MVQNAKTDVADMVKEYGYAELKTKVEMLIGDPAEEILNVAENNPESKIIMSAFGQGGLRSRLALERVTDRVVNASTVPVTLLRTEKGRSASRPKGTLKNILAPVDRSRKSEVSLPYIKEMAQLVKAIVTFIHIIHFEVSFYGLSDNSRLEQKRIDAGNYLCKLVEGFKVAGINAD